MNRLAPCMVMLGWLAACGGDEEDLPRAKYEVFTLELGGLSEGALVHPGDKLAYKVRYQGDLARNLRVVPTYTHEPSGETVSFPFLAAVTGGPDSTRFETSGNWVLKEDFLKRTGRIRVQLRAEITATLRGSVPWTVEAPSVYVDLAPAIDSVQVLQPEQPALYGMPVQLTVNGRDLWGDVALTVNDLDTGRVVANLELLLPFAGTPSVSQSWTIIARELERLGTRRVSLTARYAGLEAQSAPFSFEVTYTLDAAVVQLRDSAGNLVPASAQYRRLSDIAEAVLRVVGQQLAGHSVSVNGLPSQVATSDDQELLRFAPKADDFASGEGRRTWEFFVRSGPFERQASFTLQRWGLDSCGWAYPDGRPIPSGTTLPIGASVVMRAQGWGFADTQTYLGIYKTPLSTFTIWERDPGGRVDPVQKIDPLNNNDDEVDSFDGEIRSGHTERSWTVEYDEEAGVVLDPIHLNAAEFYFEVELEDQVCDSGEIWVYP